MAWLAGHLGVVPELGDRPRLRRGLRSYPSLTRERIAPALACAANLAREEALLPEGRRTSLGQPPDPGTVLRQGAVRGQQEEVLLSGLGDQQAVERVGVKVRQ
jgi:hypothetical protein